MDKDFVYNFYNSIYYKYSDEFYHKYYRLLLNWSKN